MTFVEKLGGMDIDHPIDAKADVKFEDFLPIKMDNKYFYYNVGHYMDTVSCNNHTSVLGKFHHPTLLSSCVLDHIQNYGEHFTGTAGYSEDTQVCALTHTILSLLDYNFEYQEQRRRSFGKCLQAGPTAEWQKSVWFKIFVIQMRRC